MTAWTIGGVTLPATIIFVPVLERDAERDSGPAQRDMAAATRAYEGTGNLWTVNGSTTMDRLRALADMRDNDEWLPVFTDDGSVAPMTMRVAEVSGYVQDAASVALVRIVLRPVTVAERMVESETEFVQNDF